jgi:hypothetical protein
MKFYYGIQTNHFEGILSYQFQEPHMIGLSRVGKSGTVKYTGSIFAIPLPLLII